MQSLLIFGASRGVGLELARLARAAGRPVAAMLRPQSDAGHLQEIGVQVLRDPATSRKAFAAVDQNRMSCKTPVDPFPLA